MLYDYRTFLPAFIRKIKQDILNTEPGMLRENLKITNFQANQQNALKNVTII